MKTLRQYYDRIHREISNEETPAAFEERIKAAKQGFRKASECRDAWFSGVNSCPYGGASPGTEKANPLAHAWYRGWWFFFYVVGPWMKASEK